eukprot:15190231-Alexandrium_andersonii.AAC.1
MQLVNGPGVVASWRWLLQHMQGDEPHETLPNQSAIGAVAPRVPNCFTDGAVTDPAHPERAFATLGVWVPSGVPDSEQATAAEPGAIRPKLVGDAADFCHERETSEGLELWSSIGGRAELAAIALSLLLDQPLHVATD